MDGNKTNGIHFLITVSRSICFRTAGFVPTQTTTAYRSALNNVFRINNTAGFRIITIHCDNEFQSIMEQLHDVYKMRMNYDNPHEHVPKAERSNTVLKKRIRAAFHPLPLKMTQKIMVKLLKMECATKISSFPPTGGISLYYGPGMILHQKALDYAKHCKI
jgi:hypothetical protein